MIYRATYLRVLCVFPPFDASIFISLNDWVAKHARASLYVFEFRKAIRIHPSLDPRQQFVHELIRLKPLLPVSRSNVEHLVKHWNKSRHLFLTKSEISDLVHLDALSFNTDRRKVIPIPACCQSEFLAADVLGHEDQCNLTTKGTGTCS